MIDHREVFLRHHDQLAAEHLAWQARTGQLPVNYNRAYDETAAAAREWYRREVAGHGPIAIWLVHGVLCVGTFGLWAPIALIHLFIVHKAREMRYGNGR